MKEACASVPLGSDAGLWHEIRMVTLEFLLLLCATSEVMLGLWALRQEPCTFQGTFAELTSEAAFLATLREAG